MANDETSSSFWTSMPGALTAITGLLTAGAGLLVALTQVGVLGGGGSSGAAEQPAVISSSQVTPSQTTSSPPASSSTAGASASGPVVSCTSSASSAPPSVPPTSASPAPSAPVDGNALAGTWCGKVSSSDGPFEVTLTVTAPCQLSQPCGTMSASLAPCTGRASLSRIVGSRYTMFLDQFTADSSRDCTPGAGEYFEVVDVDHLKYFTGYSDAAGILTRVS